MRISYSLEFLSQSVDWFSLRIQLMLASAADSAGISGMSGQETNVGMSFSGWEGDWWGGGPCLYTKRVITVDKGQKPVTQDCRHSRAAGRYLMALHVETTCRRQTYPDLHLPIHSAICAGKKPSATICAPPQAEGGNIPEPNGLGQVLMTKPYSVFSNRSWKVPSGSTVVVITEAYRTGSSRIYF